MPQPQSVRGLCAKDAYGAWQQVMRTAGATRTGTLAFVVNESNERPRPGTTVHSRLSLLPKPCTVPVLAAWHMVYGGLDAGWHLRRIEGSAAGAGGLRMVRVDSSIIRWHRSVRKPRVAEARAHAWREVVRMARGALVAVRG